MTICENKILNQGLQGDINLFIQVLIKSIFTICSGLEVAFIDVCDTVFGLQMMYMSFSINPIIHYSQVFVLLLMKIFFPMSQKYRSSNRKISPK